VSSVCNPETDLYTIGIPNLNYFCERRVISSSIWYFINEEYIQYYWSWWQLGYRDMPWAFSIQPKYSGSYSSELLFFFFFPETKH
jgi:hypothetical protein